MADAASIKLPKRIPYHVAMDLLLTGRWFDAAEALRWGLVNEVTAPDELMARGLGLARLSQSGPPLVYAAIKEVVREAEAMRFQDTLNRITKRQLATVDRLYLSEDQSRRRPRLCRKTRSGLEGTLGSCPAGGAIGRDIRGGRTAAAGCGGPRHGRGRVQPGA